MMMDGDEFALTMGTFLVYSTVARSLFLLTRPALDWLKSVVLPPRSMKLFFLGLGYVPKNV